MAEKLLGLMTVVGAGCAVAFDEALHRPDGTIYWSSPPGQ